MATSKEFKEYVAEKLGPMGEISIRPMMGEFLLYFNGKLFGGIYDGRVLIKVASTNEKFGLQNEIPYAGAKPMLRLVWPRKLFACKRNCACHLWRASR